MNADNKPPRILIVDDHPRSAEIVGRLLVRNDCKVTLAADGADALNLLAEEPFDAVVSDLEMPGMSGWELLARVHKRYPRLPVILMTAFYEDGKWASALAWGAQALLIKPFAVEELAGALQAAWRRADRKPVAAYA